MGSLLTSDIFDDFAVHTSHRLTCWPGNNVPHTIDRKRIWDDVDDDSLGASVDVEQLKRRRIAQAQDEENEEAVDDADTDVDSMLGSGSENEDDASAEQKQRRRAGSTAASTTSTNLDLTPDSLALKFPQLFNDEVPPTPKILITTSLDSTLHHEAEILCNVFPNSVYVRRQAHHHGHKYSLREISKFASNRQYTAVVMLKEDYKKPTGLTIVHLPSGRKSFEGDPDYLY